MNYFSLEFEIPLVSFIFIIILNINYFSKKRIQLIENKMYEIILIMSLIISSVDTFVHIIGAYNTLDIIYLKYFNIVELANKIMSIGFIIIFSCLFCYTYLISYNKEKYRKLFLSVISIDLILLIFMLFTHININEIGNVRNVSGSTIILGYFVVAIYILGTIILSLKNFKKKDKRFYAIFLILIMMTILYILSILIRGLIIYDLIIALLCYIMYFTIENPDIKLVNKLNLALINSSKLAQAQKELLISMSHEIRTPLNAIVGFSELIEESNTLKEAKENAHDIIEASDNLLKMVNNIVDISKINTDEMTINNKEYNLNKLIEEVISPFEYKIKEKNLKLIIKKNKLPQALIGDYIKIKRILFNILDNAVKYTNKGYVKLTVNTKIINNKCNIKFIIEDTGIGINNNIKNKLYNNFTRAEENINGNISGLGLGLPLTKNLVDLLKGSIKIESNENKGTKVIIVLKEKVGNKK